MIRKSIKYPVNISSIIQIQELTRLTMSHRQRNCQRSTEHPRCQPV